MAIAATRTLYIADAQGARRDVHVEIGVPEQRSDHWACQFHIGWPESPVRREVGGADGIQALFNAMQMIAMLLYSSDYHLAGKLVWVKPGLGFGFPMPNSSRDLLAGEDRRQQL